MRFRWMIIFGFLVAAGATTVAAQTDRATLEGTVLDASGAIVAGAKVEIVAVATDQHQERQSNSVGTFRFPGIAIGNYRVTVSHAGFQTIQFTDILVEVGETRTMDVHLVLGATETRVEVRATSADIERTSAESGTVIGQDQIGNLPINGRNWATLTILSPWAQDDGGGDQRTIRFAGRGRDDNNFTLDGADATGIQEQAQKSQVRLQISQDAISEYRVASALYTAEYGAGAGGQINVVTKSGSNDFHGSIYEYLRNSVFDARQFLDPSPVPPFRLNQYGLTFGGPLVKDKTFFFLSYEGLRQFQGQTLVAPVPNAALQQQVLTTSPALCPVIQAYPWRASTGGNIAGCAARFLFPDAAFMDVGDGFTDNFTHIGSTIIHEDTWLARLDHRINAQTSLYVRAQRDIALSSAPLGNALDTQGTINHPANYLAAIEYTASPNVLDEFKFGINRSPFHNPQFSVFSLGVSTTNFEPLNNNATDNEVGTSFSWIDNLTITNGRHTFKTGLEIRRVRLNQGITADSNISFTTDTGGANSGLINDVADGIAIRQSWCCRGLRHTFLLPYFQDEWKVTPTLTLNLGLRWEFYKPITEANGRTTIFDASCTTGGPQPGICPAGSAIFFPSYRNFDPRVSLAWAPSALHSNTVIRTGFGIYHGAGQNDDLNAALESNTFRINVTSATPNLPAPLTFPISPAFLTDPTLQFLTPRALQRHRRDLYVEDWGLTVQQALPGNFLFTTSYLGTHGVRLFARTYTNVCQSFDALGNCVQQFPNLGFIDIKNNDGTSSYNGLLLSLQRRITNGWSFQTNYTFSHSINDGSIGGGEANAPENVACRRCDRGPSVFDVRHNLVVDSFYELPIGPDRKFWNAGGFAGKLLEGWSLSGIGVWHTGHPLTVLFAPSASQIPDGNVNSDQRPDVIPGVPLTLPSGSSNPGQQGVPFINPAAFQAPPNDPASGNLLRFGNEGRGLIRSPHIWQVDMALHKDTKLTERLALELAVEAFNVFNHTQLGDPSNLTLDYTQSAAGAPWIASPSGDFGLIKSTVNFNNNNDNFAPGNTGPGLPRQLQFSLRLKF